MSDDISRYFSKIEPHPFGLLITVLAIILLVIEPDLSLIQCGRYDTFYLSLFRVTLLKPHTFFYFILSMFNQTLLVHVSHLQQSYIRFCFVSDMFQLFS